MRLDIAVAVTVATATAHTRIVRVRFVLRRGVVVVNVDVLVELTRVDFFKRKIVVNFTKH